jgi:hypothetical protein
MAPSNQIEAVREAFSSGEFAKAQQLWEGEAERVRSLVENGNATPEVLTDLAETLAWAREVHKAFKAQAEALLAANRVAGRYASGPPLNLRTRAVL